MVVAQDKYIHTRDKVTQPVPTPDLR